LKKVVIREQNESVVSRNFSTNTFVRVEDETYVYNLQLDVELPSEQQRDQLR